MKQLPVVLPPPWTVIPRVGLPLLQAFAARGSYGLTICGAQPSSWYRDSATNRAVGGLPTSQHLLGLAFDSVISPRGCTAVELAATMGRLGLVGLVEADHVHTQAFPAGTIPASVFRGLP